jgi:hypothetical protein
VLPSLLKKTDAATELHADSAYRSEEIEDTLQRRGVQSKIHEKGYRKQPLTKSQMRSNRAKSRIRARVGHVFAHITNCMNGFRIRSIGIERARSNIGLINLTYNIVALGISSGGVVCPGFNWRVKEQEMGTGRLGIKNDLDRPCEKSQRSALKITASPTWQEGKA